MNWMLAINIAVHYVDGEDCNKHNYDDRSPFLHRRTKLSQGWTSLCAPAQPVLWEKTSCSSMMLTSSIWILWSKKGVQPSLPYRQSSSGLLWCCRKKSNEWTIWYVEYKQNKSEVLLLKPEGAKWKILYFSFIHFSNINQNLGKLKLVEYKLFSKTPSGQNPSNPGVGNVSMSALIRGVKLSV